MCHSNSACPANTLLIGFVTYDHYMPYGVSGTWSTYTNSSGVVLPTFTQKVVYYMWFGMMALVGALLSPLVFTFLPL